MGETPDDIKRQMSDTRSDIETTLGSLQASSASTASDARTRVAGTIDTIGTAAGNAGASFANSIPTMENAMPLVIATAIAGFAIGFFAPLSDFERTRLRPVGDEVLRRAKNARQEIFEQSRAVVDETLGAAKASATKHGKEAAENLGV